ncbi:PaaX family transcriptional regulator [Amycolatopsis thermalba]|uniref:PaaX family transcriptional regulator n=1 Tax=Amycolatopsis thermalba TaxID=944492 RepID=UPI001FC93F51|nr:PaaX family transcriptional regulator C-terminal domain-containing protein [Amycolatopsis thermalba]
MTAVATGADENNGRGQQPRALIVTVYGLYAREAGGWMSVAALIQLLAHCGVDEPAVRSAVFRLKRRGLLTAAKVGGAAGYELSATAREILDEGDRRIFERRRADAGEGWLMAVFSVPESERDKRHQLRSRLSWLGFGTVSSGVWIAPAHLLGETREALLRQGLDPYVELFHADHLGFAATAERVRDWWDLQRLHELYDTFLGRHEPVLARYRRRRRIDGAEAFADYVHALTDWRRLPYLEPGLPLEVLPAGWIGLRAAEVFFELRRRLAGPAHGHVEPLLAR